MDREVFLLAIVMNTLIIAGGVLAILMAMYQRGKTREMHHRERLAMIERGLAPSPERDPAAFEAAERRQGYGAATSIGVVIVALGLGLMLLIGFTANEGEIALGVGGAVAVIGIAFIVIGELQRRSSPRTPSGYSTAPPPPPSRSTPGIGE